MESEPMRSRQQVGGLQVESDRELPTLPLAISRYPMPVYPTTGGIFDTAYGCSGDNAQTLERARIEAELAVKQDDLEKEEQRRQRHEILEEASMDFFEGTPPALLNAFLYSREHELGPALFNAAAAFPLLGSLMMRGKRGIQAAKQIPYHPRIGTGATSIVRDYPPGEVLKEIMPIYRLTGVLADLKPGEKEKLAEVIVAATASLRKTMGGIIPETRLAGPGFIRQTKVEGPAFFDLNWRRWLRATINMRRARKKVEAWAKTQKLDLPKDWQWRLDLHKNNFVFDDNGDIKGLIDPFWIGHESWWDHVHPFLWLEKLRL